MTNATKANLIAALNALLGLLLAFDVPLSTVQTGAILVFANALLAIFVGFTFKRSPKRLPDGDAIVVVEDGKVARATG